jgi:hypothetical protein
MDLPQGPVGLIVYVGGLNEKLDRIEPLLTELAKVPELAAADHYVYSSPVKRFSRGRLADRGDELAAAISNYWQTQGRPSNVLLMGHSIGGLLVRKAYLSALGDPTQKWVQKVSRIVLFAAPNRGIQTRSLGFFVGRIVSLVLSVSHGWSAGDMLRGSPFLTNLRVQWLRTVPLMANPPLVVQIRGTRDTAVSKADSIDLQAMPNSTSVEVYGADHRSIIDPTRPNEGSSGRAVHSALQRHCRRPESHRRAPRPGAARRVRRGLPAPRHPGRHLRLGRSPARRPGRGRPGPCSCSTGRTATCRPTSSCCRGATTGNCASSPTGTPRC